MILEVRLAPNSNLPVASPMPSAVEMLGAYLHLAQAAGRRQRPQTRARLLFLAGAEAEALGTPEIAHACRKLILSHNPAHLLGRGADFRQLLESAEGAALHQTLLRRYPPERVEQLLAKLGIEHRGERRFYYADGEYAAAILGRDWNQLVAEYRESRH